MSESPKPFREYETVQKYIADMEFKDYSPADKEARLTVLEEFCAFVGKTPDEMVDEIFDTVTRKYKRRNFYTAQVKEFSAQVAGSWSEQTARGNVVRNFFIANGRRLPNEQPDWL